jgi:hypothetical protein
MLRADARLLSSGTAMPDAAQTTAHPYRRLIASLAFFLATHALGLLTMAIWLLPGIDPARPAALRMEYLGQHLWAWRLGWLPWQLSALSDAWVCYALGRWSDAQHRAQARRWTLLSLGLFVTAALPEQYAEALLSFRPTGSHFQLSLWLTGTWANTAYTLMTGCWMLALRDTRESVWPRWAEALLLTLFMAAGLANHVACDPSGGAPNQLAFAISSLLNGLAFPGLLVFSLGMAIRVGELERRSLPTRPPKLCWPVRSSWPMRVAISLADSAGFRDLMRIFQSLLPLPRLRSDVGDVLYLNWLVPAAALEQRLGRGLSVQRLGDQAVLTALVFRHGHFGPAFLGPLRALLPSPIQCNVRIYLQTPPLHVAFLANSIDHPLYVLGARLGSDGLPVHLPAHARFERVQQTLRVDIEPGQGSALSVRATVRESESALLPAAFASVFGDFAQAVAFLVPQNAAVRWLDTVGRRCVSPIMVEAAPESARPAQVVGRVELGLGDTLDPVLQSAECFAFVLPSVRFTALAERLI